MGNNEIPRVGLTPLLVESGNDDAPTMDESNNMPSDSNSIESSSCVINNECTRGFVPCCPENTDRNLNSSMDSEGAESLISHLPPLYDPVLTVAPPLSVEDEDDGRIRLGICAMDKKARSKPMAEILSRLDESVYRVVFFGDALLLESDIEHWPLCDALIAFFSKGFPLKKAKEYVRLRSPYVLNDLDLQEVIQDRRRVYDVLEGSGIDVPRHAYLSRDGYQSTGSGDGNGGKDQEVTEFDDHVIINGITITKPFVEKPVDAENHNICIYYPTTAGGGCKKLFRKIGNRSSEFYPDINEVRRGDDKSYIYEEFVETQGTDVKMYTVGPEYGHAEARKSPAVDGKVERTADGKEVRFPVILTYREKEIARRIVLVFKQWICGFDILRVQEGRTLMSYVCDVNGFSFVKNSSKYYDDCAQILSEHLIATLRPAKARRLSVSEPLVTTRWNHRLDEAGKTNGDEHLSFLSRAARMLKGEPSRRGDESIPDCDKSSTHPASVENGDINSLMHVTDGSVVAATTLLDGALPVREFPNDLMSEPASISQGFSAAEMDRYNDNVCSGITTSSLPYGSHQEELRCVLAIIRHGDRTPKQKLKLIMNEPHILQYFHDHTKDCKSDLKVKGKAPMTEFLFTVKTTLQELERSPANESLRYELLHMRDILERWKIVGLNRKLQFKPRTSEKFTDENGETRERCTSLQLILKWGGNLTRLGEKQSICLGQRLRHEMYPDANVGGILRLHSTFRHDLKIKTSDEGRVMKTAAAFAKGLLELEGDLPPILVSLVHKDKGSLHMLDPSGNKEVKVELDECKEKISANLQRDIDVDSASEAELNQLAGPKEITSIRQALTAIENPRTALTRIHQMIGELLSQLGEMLGAFGSGEESGNQGDSEGKGEVRTDFALSGVKLYKGETLLELTERWRFIYENLYNTETDTFDLSRIPDVHDNVRFDVLHNPHLGLADTLHRLYKLAKNVADCVVPQEYGTTIAEKRSVGVKICHGLLEKIMFDLSVARTDNEVEPMRFMINTEYSQDLPINTMGRRIRTRLYFTSESHLHTVLNVLRFATDSHDEQSVLSKEGIEIINNTPELCYLTHIVLRVFEDSRPEMQNDPRRFRVEILFSPGATATPLHINETDRDGDASRCDTAPLQVIGRDGLCCEELEAFFGKALSAGLVDDSRNPKEEDLSTVEETSPKSQNKAKKKKSLPSEPNLTPLKEQGKNGTDDNISLRLSAVAAEPSIGAAYHFDATIDSWNRDGVGASNTDLTESARQEPQSGDDEVTNDIQDEHDANDDEGDETEDLDSDEVVRRNSVIARKIVYRKVFWTTVAIGSFVLGASCLVLAVRVSNNTRPRRWSTSRRM
jgi:inositol-hexakisphosphate/diphosphoinositol-pentakisphosphate 1-kinase